MKKMIIYKLTPILVFELQIRKEVKKMIIYKLTFILVFELQIRKKDELYFS